MSSARGWCSTTALRDGDRARRPHLLDGGLRHPRPSPAAARTTGWTASAPTGRPRSRRRWSRSSFARKGMVVPIIRPKSFIGPERLGVFALLYDWALDGRNFPIDRQRQEPLPVARRRGSLRGDLALPDAARAHVNDTFNIGAAEFGTMARTTRRCSTRRASASRCIPFPAAPAIWRCGSSSGSHVSPLYKWVYETASKDSFVSIEKAREQLSWQPQFSNKDALLRNFAWYKQHEAEFANSSGVSHRVPCAGQRQGPDGRRRCRDGVPRRRAGGYLRD